MLASDSIRLYQTLKGAGQEVTLDPIEGMWHAFQAFDWRLPESKVALNETIGFLKGYLKIEK